MQSEDVDLANDVDLDLDLDNDMDLNNDYASRAVENAIRGCGPCSPDPEPAGGGAQDCFSFPHHQFTVYICYIIFSTLFATYICYIICYIYLLHL